MKATEILRFEQPEYPALSCGAHPPQKLVRGPFWFIPFCKDLPREMRDILRAAERPFSSLRL
jgi:hypothetical protein